MALVIGLGVLVFSSVMFRYFFNSPIEWADEVVGFFILGLTYCGSQWPGPQVADLCGDSGISFEEETGALRWVRISVDTVVMVTLIRWCSSGFSSV